MSQSMPTTMRICSFKGLQNLPLYVAMREGFFDHEGLALELTYTMGSAPQLAGLARGLYHLIQTAPDNVINFDHDPAAFGIDAAASPRAIMVLGGSNGPLSIFARPGVTNFASLRGSSLGVDNPGSGFALVLRDLLARQGLLLDRDYEFVVAGSTAARCEALIRGDFAATILYTPFDLRATAAGCMRLIGSTDVYRAYASMATAGLQGWIEAHADLVTRYIRGFLRGVRWIYDPAHAQPVQQLMQDESELALSAELAVQAYAAFVMPETGFGATAPLDDAGLEQVIALRGAYGSSRGSLGQPALYRDVRWYDQARRTL